MTRGPRLLPFVAVAMLLVAVLFSDSLVMGRKLSQADLLYRYPPWSAHAPAGFTAPVNDLLGDVPTVFYPFLAHTAASFRAGKLPLWSPALYGGYPFLAAFQTATFSPFTVPALWLAPADALLVAAIGKLLVGGIGMWLFLRRIGLTSGGVWFGALAYLLNPFSLVWLEHPLSTPATWFPLVLWSTDRVLASRGRRDAALLAVIVAVTILAGHPETSYKVLLCAGAYGLAGTWVATGAETASRRDRLGRALRLVLTRFMPAAVLALLLAAIQLVPFAEYLRQTAVWQSRRATSTNIYPAPLETLITAVVPNFLGNPSRGAYLPMENAYGVPSNFSEQQIYPGSATWIFAAVGVVAGRRSWRVRFFAATLVLAALLMYGAPGVLDLFFLVPGASVVVLTRFGLVAITAAMILAAFGVDAVARGSRDRPAPLWPAALTAASMALGIGVFLVWAWRFLQASPLAAATPKWCGFALALAALAVALVWWRTRAAAPLVPVAACALIAVDLLAFGWRFHATLPRDQVFPLVPEVALVVRDPGLFRVAGIGGALLPNGAMAYGLQDLRGYDGTTPARHQALMRTVHAGGWMDAIRATDSFRLLDLMNVKYIFADGATVLPANHFTRIAASPGAAVFRNDRAFPRAFLVGRVRVVPDAEALHLLRTGQIDLRHEALVADRLEPAEVPDASSDSLHDTARVVHYENTRVVIDVAVARRALLVLGNVAYPGWAATVDEAPARVLRADYALRAVAVPPGRHRVTFTYAPQSLRLGLSGTLAGLVGVALLAWVRRRH